MPNSNLQVNINTDLTEIKNLIKQLDKLKKLAKENKQSTAEYDKQFVELIGTTTKLQQQIRN